MVDLVQGQQLRPDVAILMNVQVCVYYNNNDFFSQKIIFKKNRICTYNILKKKLKITIPNPKIKTNPLNK